MENSGHGGITMGPLEMKQWIQVTEKDGFPTRGQAEAFAFLLVNSTYGVMTTDKLNIETMVTEKDGLFYIWYRKID